MITVLGIRHHGPGSAGSVLAELEKLRPDLVLVEGPPDADALIPLAAHPDMQPPVALLVYNPENPQQAVYYPFAEFSPEWQALLYANKAGIPARFMDLPQSNRLGRTDPAKPAVEPDPENERTAASAQAIQEHKVFDPFAMIASAAGYSDGERWWEHFVEQRRVSGEVFQEIIELMTALRLESASAPTRALADDPQREAFMRKIIRAALAEGRQNIVVVCGAWHAPALGRLDDEKGDEILLKDLPVAKTTATWVPWTYDRLARRSGYGAGIDSPGWYEHLWKNRTRLIEQWLVKISHLMRAEDLAISPAHAIEAARLADTLAALRGMPLPGLPELDEAVQAVYCFGDPAPMRLIREKLIVGQRLGRIPPGAPSVPLQRDLAAAQKHARMEPSAEEQILDLDLRKGLSMDRSQLLHRLNLLDITWGELQTIRGAKGTFHEVWRIAWKPEFAVRVIEASPWGNTLHEAVVNKVRSQADQISDLPELTRLVESALLARLSDSIPGLMQRLEQLAASSADVAHLMAALPPLVNILRYGDVRQTDTNIIRQVVAEMIARVCIGLPSACQSLSEDAAQAILEAVNAFQAAVMLLEDAAQAETWAQALAVIAAQEAVHGLIRGRACRLLFERAADEAQTITYMSRALSPGTPAEQAAAWVQGFLEGGGQALIHHPRLWSLVDAWLLSISEDMFNAVLPLLRRTFNAFSAPERRQIGEIARRGVVQVASAGSVDLDPVRAANALNMVMKILEKTNG